MFDLPTHIGLSRNLTDTSCHDPNGPIPTQQFRTLRHFKLNPSSSRHVASLRTDKPRRSYRHAKFYPGHLPTNRFTPASTDSAKTSLSAPLRLQLRQVVDVLAHVPFLGGGCRDLHDAALSAH